jgi:DNA-binding PadR family transcriptional regulator
MTPVFAHGRLRLYLLSLLAESPRHGYELIQDLETRFGGTYVPSAGTIYPRLAKLEDEGLVTKTTDGRKSIYAITDLGRAELANRADEMGDLEEELSDSVRRLANDVRAGVGQAMKSLRADLAAAARDAREDTKRFGTREQVSTPERNSRRATQDAEFAVEEFRNQLKADLRGAAAKGKLTDEAAIALRLRLQSVREEFLTNLRE